MTALEPEQQVHTLAVMRQSGFRGKVRTSTGATGGFAGRRPATPLRTEIGAARPMRCANCGGEHSTRDCVKPMLEESQRACFGCGKTGHQSRDCPDKHKQQRPSAGAPPRGGPPRGDGRPGRGQGAHLVQDGSEITTLMVTCEDEDGFSATRSRCRRNAAADLSLLQSAPSWLHST